jgi:hypothetical protein
MAHTNPHARTPTVSVHTRPKRNSHPPRTAVCCPYRTVLALCSLWRCRLSQEAPYPWFFPAFLVLEIMKVDFEVIPLNFVESIKQGVFTSRLPFISHYSCSLAEEAAAAPLWR